MDDSKIIELYFAREESALAETDQKYGKFGKSLARAILYSEEDSEECWNDTLWKAWGSIPPHKPSFLKAFLGKIVRYTALDRYEHAHAQKRNLGATVILDEAESMLAQSTLTDPSDELALKAALHSFISDLPRRTRIVFLRRYWYFCSVKDIANGMGMSESAVKVMLLRTRERLKEHLEKEGIVL